MSNDNTKDWVLDPFDVTADNTELIITEEHEIKKITALGSSWYGFRTNYAPAFKQLPDGYKVLPTDDLKTQVILNSSTQLTEVGRTQIPNSSQYRVDYDPYLYGDGSSLSNYLGTGRIQFDSSLEGQFVTITYWSSGLMVSGSNLGALLEDQVIPGNFEIDGELNKNNAKIINLADGTNNNDAVTVVQMRNEVYSRLSILDLIKYNRATDVSIAADTTKTLSAKHATVNNLTIATGKTLTIDNALQGIGVLHVYGDLTLSGTAVLELRRVLLIVYGDIITTSGTIRCPKNPSNGTDGVGSGTSATAANSLVEYGGLGGAGVNSATQAGNPGSGIGGAGSGGCDSASAAIAGGTPSDALQFGSGGGGAGGTGSVSGGNQISGDTYCINDGGQGGATLLGGAGGGGGGGGFHLNLIVFGSISSGLTLRSGLPGEGGAAANGGASDAPGHGGKTGNLNLFSQYTSAPCTVQVSKGTTYGNVRDGLDGTANYNSLDMSSLFGILNDITKNPSHDINHANQIGYLYWTKQGVAF